MVRPAETSDSKFYWEHIRRHENESGRDGDVIFSPNEETWMRSFEDFEKERHEKWKKTVFEIGWERSWVIVDADGIYGKIKLIHQPPLKTSLHRATLMMGIERAFRSRGFGSQLMSEAIDWARIQPPLDWLQLFVFDENEPAKALYKKFGFCENGTTPDMLRVFGKKVADISMILKLK